MLAPLPFGSVGSAWTALWCLPMALSLAGARIGSISRSLVVVLAATVGLVACLAALAALQTSALLPAAPIWEEASLLLGMDLGTRASVTRIQPLAALGAPLLMAMTFCRFALLGRRAADARFAVKLLAVAGLAYVLVSILNFMIAPEMLLWREKTAYLHNLTGTFVNRNTAATFFGSVAAIWLVLFLETLKRAYPRDAKLRDWLWLIAARKDRLLIFRGTGFILSFAAVAATGSRAGLLLTIAVLLLAGTIYLSPRRLPSPRNAIWLLALVLLAAFFVELTGGAVASRLHLIGFDDEGRFEVYRAQWRLIAQNPLFGIGLGNFEAVFPSVRPPTVSILGVWDMGHSSPLEFAVEAGLPMAAAVATFWLGILWLLTRSALRRRDTPTIAALSIGLLGTLHSVVDFSLQIPGYAVFFAAVTAIGVGRALGSHAPPLRRTAPTVN